VFERYSAADDALLHTLPKDLVLVLNFPESRIREDEGSRVYEQLQAYSLN